MPFSARLGGAFYFAVTVCRAIVVADAPELHMVPPGSPFNGVAALAIARTSGISRCSGSLLEPGYFVLTAAHCLTDSTGRISTVSSSISFLPSGEAFTTQGGGYVVHPGWSGDISLGFDVGLIRLREMPPDTVERYSLYRGAIELHQVMFLLGYGASGTGHTGIDRTRYPFGTLRFGHNRFDETGDILISSLPGSVLLYDFDDGTALHDAFGSVGMTSDFGLGSAEATISAGDSGGPSFIDGRIAGIHSFLAVFSSPPDIDNIQFNSSLGELGGDTRVSVYVNYIDSVTAVPEPSCRTLAGLCILFAGTGRALSRKTPLSRERR
jgi:hypothetical protein